MTEGVDPQLARYSNQELEAFLANPRMTEAQKTLVRQELTRRMRDDLLKSAQGVVNTKVVERRKQAWKMGRLSFLIVLLLLCVVTALCALFFTQPDLFHRIFGNAAALPSLIALYL